MSFPIGWLINRGVWRFTPEKQQVNDDRWYTKPAPLFLPKEDYWELPSGKRLQFANWKITIIFTGKSTNFLLQFSMGFCNQRVASGKYKKLLKFLMEMVDLRVYIAFFWWFSIVILYVYQRVSQTFSNISG